MKKVFSILLALVLVFSLTTVAFASDAEPAAEVEEVIDLTEEPAEPAEDMLLEGEQEEPAEEAPAAEEPTEEPAEEPAEDLDAEPAEEAEAEAEAEPAEEEAPQSRRIMSREAFRAMIIGLILVGLGVGVVVLGNMRSSGKIKPKKPQSK